MRDAPSLFQFNNIPRKIISPLRRRDSRDKIEGIAVLRT